MLNEERVEKLKKLIEEGKLFTTGDAIHDPIKGQTLLVFIRTPNSLSTSNIEGSYSLATPFGMTLFDANDFHNWCVKQAEDSFYKQLDILLMQRSSGLQLPSNNSKLIKE